MPTKKEIMESLTSAGIDYDPNETKAELEKLLSGAEVKKEEPAEPAVMEETSKPKEVAKRPEKKVIPPGGSREVEQLPGQEKRKVDEKELMELQEAGRLFGYDPETRVASFWKE